MNFKEENLARQELFRKLFLKSEAELGMFQGFATGRVDMVQETKKKIQEETPDYAVDITEFLDVQAEPPVVEDSSFVKQLGSELVKMLGTVGWDNLLEDDDWR